EAAPGHVEIARALRADRDHDRIVIRTQLLPRGLRADGDSRAELDALGRQDREPAIDDVLLHLEVGDAIAQQPAGLLGGLVNDRRVARAVQTRGGGQTRRPAPDDRDALSRAPCRRPWRDPALGERTLDDGALEMLDRDGARRRLDG